MNLLRNLFIAASLILLLATCKKDEEASADGNMLSYSVSNLSNQSLTIDQIFIEEPSHHISIIFANTLHTDSLPISFTSDFELSTGATSIPASGEKITINNIDEPFTYSVTAENGTIIEYTLVLRDNQLPNSGFEDWYSTSGMNSVMYKECGKSAETTVWATANYGTSIYGVYCTIPVEDGNNTYAKIITGETTMVPITAGTIFTGKFDINGAINNPTNPRKATLFGIPFSLRPYALKFKYTYKPGSRYIRATLNDPSNIFGGFTKTDIEGGDKYTAYAVLEKRDLSGTLEIGRAEVFSGDIQETFTEITIPFNYTSSEKPTHIYVVFSSSKEGEFFTGAVGSTLKVDDVELIYE